MRFSMREGISTSTGPSGRPQIARTSCSNWLVAQASIVQWPELCGRGAISLASTLPSLVTNISSATSPTRSSPRASSAP
jgi:hypothetical protein